MLTEQRLYRWARELRNGRRTPQAFVDELKRLPFEDIDVARLDTHRQLRRGLPEVILSEGKTAGQLIRIVQRMRQARDPILLTRLDPTLFETIREAVGPLRYDPMARIAFHIPQGRRTLRGFVVVVTGGTSDLAVAEEAAVTLEVFGSRAARLYDVGVAGVHRLLEQWRLLQRARAIVVVAGMEGALASVVAGLVRAPVIAVPTSIGYGASFHGIAPLLTMLNSCVPGIGVVNIDNGFGAAYLAHVINQPSSRAR